MSFGDGNLHAQVAQLKTENARLKQQLDKLPEIVRCRDCEHIVWTDNPMTRTHYWCIENDRPCSLDDFCSLAERRESGGIKSIYDWDWVREAVGEEEAEKRKEQQREEESA